jgi:hypothetical protein
MKTHAIRVITVASAFVLIAATPTAAADSSAVPPGIQRHLLTDEQIAQRCQKSIQAKLDMVTSQGRKVPRCVHTYERLREVSRAYVANLDQSAGRVQASMQGSSCGEKTANATQATCLNASRKVASAAADSHKDMAAMARKARAEMKAVAQEKISTEAAQ